MLAQQLANGLTTGLVYGLLALGFSLAYSSTRVINFAHGEFFTLGALLSITLQRGRGLPALAASPIAAVTITIAAVAFAFFILWWLRTPLQRSVATIAVSLGLRDAMLLAFGSDNASFPRAPADGSFVVLDAAIPRYAALLSVWTVALLVAFWFLVARTRLGLWMRATAQDPELAATNGIAIRRVEAGAFALGALAAAAAGLLIGPSWQVSYSSGSVVGVKAFTSAMLGGLGRLDGAVAGGILLGLVEALFAGYVSSAWKDFAVFWVLLVALLVLPRGLFSLRATRVGGGPP
jgi:branched-chain amino acid transport system permease protein